MNAIPKGTAKAKRKPNPFLKDPVPTLKRAMQVLKVSQSAAARLTRRAVHQTRISRWFDEKGRPSATQFEAICRALNITPNDCFELTPEQVTAEELETRRRVRDLIARIGYDEAFNRLIGLPPGGREGVARPEPEPPQVPEGRPAGGVTTHRLGDKPNDSEAPAPKGKNKPKAR